MIADGPGPLHTSPSVARGSHRLGTEKESATSHRKGAFRPGIQGLRGVAILLVVGFHAGIQALRGGFVGVDVFFVLSGYLITDLLVREVSRTGRLSFLSFYARRARRILPASVLVLLATIGAAHLLFSPLEQETFSQTARATAAYISNLWFTGQAGNYFSPASEANPLLHTWSLAVEEQFYLVWPFVVALALWRGRPRRVLAAVMSIIVVVSLADCVRLMKLNNAWAFYGSTPRAWEFAIGGLASLAPSPWIRTAWTQALGWLGLGAVLLAGVWFSSTTVFPGVAAMLPVLGTAAILVAGGEPSGAGASRLLETPLMQWIGNVSYSWYLWHWPVLVMAAAVAPSLPPWGRSLCAAGSLLLAATTHRLFENPIRFHPYLVKRPALSLGLAAILTMGAFGVAVRWQRTTMSLPDHQRFAGARRDIPRL